MIEEHLDPTVEAHGHLSNLARTVITAAAGAAERRAQQRAEQAREAGRLAEVERREVEQRLAAQRQAAELVYRRAWRDTWWDRASAPDITAAVTAAGIWAGGDPRADDALGHICERLAERYGIDVDLHALCAGETGPPGAAESVRQRVAETAANRPPVVAFDARSTVMDAAGPALGAVLVASKGWPRLAQRLETMAAGATTDVAGRLRTVIAGRDLDSAADKALALSWRLKGPADHNAAARRGARAARQAHGTSPAWKTAGTGATARLARPRATDRNHPSGPGHDGGTDVGR